MILTIHSFFNADISELQVYPFPDLIQGEVIDLSPFQSCPPGIDLKIFIREEYITAIKKWNSLSSGFILLGSPGIGKSTFGRLLLCLLISQKKKVIYWHSTYEYPLIFENSAANKINLSSFNNHTNTSDSTIIYDDRRGFQGLFGDRKFGKYLIIHSPSADITNSEKAANFLGNKWIMNPATLDECSDINNNCEWGIDGSDLISKFRIRGGLFRLLKKGLDVLEEDIKQGCLQVSTNLDSILNIGQLPSNSDKICHQVIHIRRIDDSIHQYLEFGSEYIERKVIEHFATSREFELLKLANGVDINGSLRGDVFENRMHHSLSKFTDFEFNTKSLPGSGEEVEIAVQTKDEPISFSKLSDIKEVNIIFK